MKAIAFHVQHDANIAAVVDDQQPVVLELERIFEQRYFESATDLGEFRMQWARTLSMLPKEFRDQEYDLAVTNWVMPSRRKVLRELVRAHEWMTVDHHVAHAALGFHDSGFTHALVFSYDGGGNDGTFKAFLGYAGALREVREVRLNLGTPYRLLGTTMPEVTGRKPQPGFGHQALAGRVMAYAAYGQVREEWRPAVRNYYEKFLFPAQALYNLGEELRIPLETDVLEPEAAQNIAATSQAVFCDLLLEQVGELIRAFPGVDGVVLTGGCALNVVANQRVRESVSVPVHVPPAPGDGGIALGSLWALLPPALPCRIAYSGLPLIEDLPGTTRSLRGARSGTVRDVAKLLANGSLVGVARGSSEVGPRALGNRSILGYPDRADLKARINERVKYREWYRPCAPVIPEELLGRYFADASVSPYMSFSPRLRKEWLGVFPSIAHVDGTARVQTVTATEHPWLHALLHEVGQLTGHPILLNTSLNTKGRPLVARSSAALELLDHTDLDAVLVGDDLYEKRP